MKREVFAWFDRDHKAIPPGGIIFWIELRDSFAQNLAISFRLTITLSPSETNTDQTPIIVNALTQWCSHCHSIDSFFMMMIFIQWIQYKILWCKKICQFEIYCRIHNSHGRANFKFNRNWIHCLIWASLLYVENWNQFVWNFATAQNKHK